MLEFFFTFIFFNSQVWLNCLMGDCSGNVVEFTLNKTTTKSKIFPISLSKNDEILPEKKIVGFTPMCLPRGLLIIIL